MGELNKNDIESVNRYIDIMFNSEFSKSEINGRLINDYNFTQYEADLAVERVYKIKLHETIKKEILYIVVLLSITLILWGLFLYFKHDDEKVARYMIEKGNGIDLGNGSVMVKGPFGFYEMFGKFAVYTLIGAILFSIKVLIGWIKYRRIS